MAESIAGNIHLDPPAHPVPLDSLNGLTLQQLLSPNWVSGQMDPAPLRAPHVQTVASSQPIPASHSFLSPLDTLLPADTSLLDRLVHSSGTAAHPLAGSYSGAPQPSDFVLMSRSSLHEMQAVANRVTRLEQNSYVGRYDAQAPMRTHTPFNYHHPYPVAGAVASPIPVAGIPFWAAAADQRIARLERSLDARRENSVRRVDGALPTQVIQSANGWEVSAQNMASQRREDLDVLNATLTNMTTVIMANMNERSEGVLRETKAVSERMKRLEDTLGRVDETNGERTLAERMHSMECMLMELLEKLDSTREAGKYFILHVCAGHTEHMLISVHSVTRPPVRRREMAIMTEYNNHNGRTMSKDVSIQALTEGQGE